MKKLLWILLGFCFIPGCLTLGPKGLLGELPALANPSEYAEVSIVRQNRFFGKGLSYRIKIDGNDVFGLKVREYIKIKLNPDRHEISATTFGGATPTTKVSSVVIDMESLKQYYCLVVSDVSRAVVVSVLDEAQAKPFLEKSSLVFESK
ncbi:MAG: hypothetical protein JW774_08490 [Candidatus Aureabacteria bacterium]|nr:hypothetical protein [Candidatus Auribacterota bacterium]